LGLFVRRGVPWNMHRFPFLALLLLLWAGLGGPAHAQSAALAVGDDGTVYVSGTTDSVPGTDVNMPSEFTAGIWPDGSERWRAPVGTRSYGNPVLAIGNGMVVIIRASDTSLTTMTVLGPDGDVLWTRNTYAPGTRAVMARLDNGDFCYAADMISSASTSERVFVQRLSSSGDVRWTRYVLATQIQGSMTHMMAGIGDACVLTGQRVSGTIAITDPARRVIQELPEGSNSLFSVAFSADGSPGPFLAFGLEDERVAGILATTAAEFAAGSMDSDSLRIRYVSNTGTVVDSVSWAAPETFDHVQLRSFGEDSVSVWQWSESPPSVYRTTLSRADGSLRHSTPTLPPSDSLTTLLGVEPSADGYILFGLGPGYDGSLGPVVIQLATDGSPMWVYRRLARKPYARYKASFSDYTIGNHWTYMVENDRWDVGPILTFDILSGEASASQEMRTVRSQELQLDGTLRNESICSFLLMEDGSVTHDSTLACSNAARKCRCENNWITNLPLIQDRAIEENVTVPVGPSDVLVAAAGSYEYAFSGGNMSSGGGHYMELHYASGVGPYQIHEQSYSWSRSGSSSKNYTARLEYARVDGVRYGNLAVNTESLPEVPESAPDGLSIYPNPARNTIEVAIQGVSSPLSNIEVFDILGRRVLSPAANTRLDVSGLESGVYLIRISDGTHTRTRSFLKVD